MEREHQNENLSFHMQLSQIHIIIFCSTHYITPPNACTSFSASNVATSVKHLLRFTKTCRNLKDKDLVILKARKFGSNSFFPDLHILITQSLSRNNFDS